MKKRAVVIILIIAVMLNQFHLPASAVGYTTEDVIAILRHVAGMEKLSAEQRTRLGFIESTGITIRTTHAISILKNIATGEPRLLTNRGWESLQYILLDYLTDKLPIQSSYKTNGITIELLRSDEEMEQLRDGYYEIIENFIKESIVFASYGITDASIVNLLGQGPAVRIPVGGWEQGIENFAPRDLPKIILTDISPTGLTYKFINETDDEFLFGSDYSLFVREGDEWRQLNQGMIFTGIGYRILPQSQTTEHQVNWQKWRGVLPAGEYAFMKSFIYWRTPGDLDSYYDWVEFKI